MKLAIKVLTEWDRENVIPFFEKHYRCNLTGFWTISDVLIGDVWFIDYKGNFIGYEAQESHLINKLSDYTILQGVPKDMELPSSEPTKTREQELEELVNNIVKWGDNYPKGLKWENHIATKIENEIYEIYNKAKQLLNK